MKTPMSRFQIHDDLTAPEGSVAVLRGALSSGGQLPNFLGGLAGSPAALRAYARFRSELRHGKLTLATLERIALAVAEHYHSESGIAMHSRAARAAGLAFDEVALARQFSSKDEREAALLTYLQALLTNGVPIWASILTVPAASPAACSTWPSRTSSQTTAAGELTLGSTSASTTPGADPTTAITS